MFANNTDYQLAYTSTPDKHTTHKFYVPTNIATGYHHSRYVEAMHNDIYARSGATKEVIRTLAEEMITICNDELNKAKLRTDIALLANNLLYRTQNPIDQQCAIRQGALLCFLETTIAPTPPTPTPQTISEDPNIVKYEWQQRKEAMALADPDLYTFFLTLGYSNLETYDEALSTLLEEDYFNRRTLTLQTMQPLSNAAEPSSTVSKPQ